MNKKEDVNPLKSRFFKGSIETLCQPSPLEKYSEELSDTFPQNPSLSSLKTMWIFILKWALLLSLLIGTFYLFIQIIRPSFLESSSSQKTYLRRSCPDFIGREKYLDILYQELIAKQDPSTVCIRGLWGKGGFGKTELATEFANRFRSHFSLIWTFYSDSEESLKQGYRDLAQLLGLYHPSDSPLKTQEKVHFYLENEEFKKPWILIFDNVEDQLPSYPQRGGAILFTSQKKIFNPRYLLEIKPFSSEEALQLLEKVTGEKRSPSMEQLIQDLEGIPLLINYAAHYIKSTPGCSIADYQSLFCTHLYEKAGPLWKEMDVNRRYLKSLASSWQFSLKALEKDNPAALAWLSVCSYLYPENIPETWIDDWLASQDKKSTLNYELKRKEILTSLQNFGVIQYREQTHTLSLHRFFQYMIRESRTAETKDDLYSAYTILSKHNYDYNFFQSISWEAGKCWYLHACEFMKWINRYPQHFSDPGSLNRTTELYTAMGRWNIFNYHFPMGLEYFYKAIDLRQTFEKQLSHSTALDYGFISHCYFQLGRMSEGLKVIEKIEEFLRNAKDINPLEFSSILDVKGICLMELKEYDAAISCMQEGLQIIQQYPGDKYVEGLFSFDSMNFLLQSNIGRCLRDLGRNDEALQYFNQAIPLGAKSVGKGHPYYVVFVLEKAAVLLQMGEPKQALQMIHKTLEDYWALNQKTSDTEAFGELGTTWNTLGNIYLQLDQVQKAKQMFRKARACTKKYLGKETPLLMRAYRGLGQVYLKEKKTKKGLRYLTQQLQMCAGYGIQPEKMRPVFEEFQKALADALQMQGSTPAVQDASHTAALLSEKLFGKDHSLTAYFQQHTPKFDNTKVKI